jgi:hypothetical protein
MTAILHVHAGESQGRATFARQRRARWASALPVVLEKHGYLDVRSCSAEMALEELAANPPALTIITQLAPEQWGRELADALTTGPFAVLLELPPRSLHPALGITSAAPAPGEGRLSACEPRFEVAVRRRAGSASAKVSGPISRPVPILPEMLWPSTDAPFDENQAAAWNAPGWTAERWSTDASTSVLAEWRGDGDPPSPAVVRRGQVAGIAVGLLAYLVQTHSAAPYRGGEHHNWPRSLAAEAMLLELIDMLHGAAGATRVRVRQWPRGHSWALNVRHDVDRLPSRRGVSHLLDRHARIGTAPTLYVRPRHLTASRAFLLRARARSLLGYGTGEPVPAAAARGLGPTAGPVGALRQARGRPAVELALHSEGLWADGDVELTAFEQAFGHRPAGASSHGGPDCFRFQGAPNVLWAEAADLDYTELILHTHMLPHRFPALRADGTIAVLRTLCLPHHESFDRSSDDTRTGRDAILERLGLWRRAGGLLQVMNHPDLNTDELFAFLAELPREGRLDTTATAAADWWRRSHVGGELDLYSDGSGTISVTSRRGVNGLTVATLAPDGLERDLDVSLGPGETTTIAREPWFAR